MEERSHSLEGHLAFSVFERAKDKDSHIAIVQQWPVG